MKERNWGLIDQSVVKHPRSREWDVWIYRSVKWGLKAPKGSGMRVQMELVRKLAVESEMCGCGVWESQKQIKELNL